MATTIQQTRRKLKREGWTVQTVEKWNNHTKRRNDLLGIIDILALRQDEPILGVQCTSLSNFAEHKHKICEDCSEATRLWLSTGARLELWGWYPDASGRLRREEIVFADTEPPEEISRQKRNLALSRAIKKERENQ